MTTINKILTLSTLYFSLTFSMGKQPPPPPPPFISLEVTGSPYQAPLFLVDTNSVNIYTQLSFYSPSSVDGHITIEGTKTINSSTSNKNFEWQIPTASLNTGISVKISKILESFAAIKIDNRENEVSISNLDLGLGLLMNQDKEFRQRLDFGISYISSGPKPKLLYIDPYNGDSLSTRGIANDGSLNFFASLTIQTAFDNWIINPYLQASYCSYNLYSDDHYNGEGIYFTTKTFTIAPGITYRISNKVLLLAGGSIFIPSGIENLSSPGIYSGFVQANFLF